MARSITKKKSIGIVARDKYLQPFEAAIQGRHDHALWKLNQLTRNGEITLSDFANGYEYFGLHRNRDGWVFREWAPNATDIFLVGDFNNKDFFGSGMGSERRIPVEG